MEPTKELTQVYIDMIRSEVPDLADYTFGVEKAEEALMQHGSALRVPSAYVILVSEAGARNQTVTLVHQRVTATFGVLIAVGNTVSPLMSLGAGADSNVELKKYRGQIRDAVLGRGGEGYGPCEFGKGRLVMVKEGVLWWQDDYMTEYFIRSKGAISHE